MRTSDPEYLKALQEHRPTRRCEWKFPVTKEERDAYTMEIASCGYWPSGYTPDNAPQHYKVFGGDNLSSDDCIKRGMLQNLGGNND